MMRFQVAIVGPNLARAEDAISEANVADIEAIHLDNRGGALVLVASIEAEDAVEAERHLQRVLPPGHTVGPARPSSAQDLEDPRE